MKLALYGLLLAGIFYTPHRVIVGWWGGEDYTYCYLIAPIVLYEVWGPAVAEDFFHGFSGWLIFILGLAVLLGEMWVLSVDMGTL